MSKRAEEAALKALPNYPRETYVDGDEGSCKNGKWTWYECNKMLRHFFELGLNARKEK